MPLRPLTRGVWILALLAAALAAWTTVRETRRWRRSPFGDFNYLQTGGECLVAGCDPYDFAALNREAARRHEPKPEIWPMTPVYPPSSLVVLLPFEPLGWPLAAYVFNGIAGFATALACVLMVWWLRIRVWDPAALVMLAAVVCLPMISAIEFGNPALLEAALIALACLLLLETRWSATGWVLLGISLALKPQLAGGAALVLLAKRETRTAAAKACGLAILLLLLGLAAYRLRLGSFHYLATLRWVLWLTTLPGATSDYANSEAANFLNLQTAIGAVPHAGRRLVNAAAWLVTGWLAAMTCWIAAKRYALRLRPWTLIALAVAISVLPVYHRGYDRVIALVLAPAAVEIGASKRWLAWLYAAAVTLWVANDTVMAHIVKRWRYKPQNGVEDVVFCAILLVSLWWSSKAPTLSEGVA